MVAQWATSIKMDLSSPDVSMKYTASNQCPKLRFYLVRPQDALLLRPEVSKKFKGLKLLVTVTVNLRIEVEVSKMKSILKWILSLIS